MRAFVHDGKRILGNGCPRAAFTRKIALRAAAQANPLLVTPEEVGPIFAGRLCSRLAISNAVVRDSEKDSRTRTDRWTFVI